MYGDCAGSGVKQHVHTPFISLSLSLFVQTRMFRTCTCITVFNKLSLALQIRGKAGYCY